MHFSCSRYNANTFCQKKRKFSFLHNFEVVCFAILKNKTYSNKKIFTEKINFLNKQKALQFDFPSISSRFNTSSKVCNTKSD